MSDMDDEQKNFPKQKLKPISNEGKRKPLSLKGNRQHRREVMTNTSKFMKLSWKNLQHELRLNYLQTKSLGK